MIMWTTALSQAAEPADKPKLEELLAVWRLARHETAAAYESWCNEEARDDRTMRYASVVAAMDREAAAEREALRALGLARGRPAPATGV
jgi:hypothetical protein